MQRRDNTEGDTPETDSIIQSLAVIGPRPTSSRDRRPGQGGSRQARLSHRSRQGCWTCRARKVKCDEAHPRCGPCSRLDRECDWDQRWNFSDATLATQGKHPNVNTDGNSVWDSNVRSSLTLSPTLGKDETDDDPEFYVLTTDEDREKKAEQRPPGTYGLVLTPRSFLRSSIPEYAATRVDDRKLPDMFVFRGLESTMPTSPLKLPEGTAPNVAILDRFEDVNLASVSSWSVPDIDRRASASDITNVSVKTELLSDFAATAPSTPILFSNDLLVHHFRRYILPRLVQPLHSTTGVHQSLIADALESEAQRFPPLYHAICALSALNLSYSGLSSLEEAMQHYHRALDAHTTASTSRNLLSDGIFFRHFLLLVYDICLTTNTGADGEADMWAKHLNQLRWLATQRHNVGGNGSSYAYTIWKICELDTYACLLGCGNGNFVQTMVQEGMLPAAELQIPVSIAMGQASTGASPFAPSEMPTFPAILGLHQVVLSHVAQIAATAQQFRIEAQENEITLPSTIARWQASTAQLQAALNASWLQAYPQQHVGPDSSPALVASLPERVRALFESTVLLYHAAVIYTRTCMYPGQGRMPFANRQAIILDMELRATKILTLAASQAINPVHRNVVFPIFIAGVATSIESNKSAAIELIGRLEDSGIGRNTNRTKRLLVAVCEEQRRLVAVGGSQEEVDWLEIARANKLDVVNCGL